MSIGIHKQVVAVVLTFAMVLSLVAVSANAQTEDELQVQIQALLSQITALQTQIGTGATQVTTVSTTNSVCPYTWSRNLSIGSAGEDVRQLQRFLNSDGITIATTGAGSVGNESTYYGSRTAAAVTRFQEKYASVILTPLGLTSGTGGFYNSTRQHANAVCASAGALGRTPSVVDTNVPFGQRTTVSDGTVEVSAASNQPSNGFAVAGAQRVPFTSFVINARGGDVRVTGVTVERFGLIDDDVFQNIYIVDPSGHKVTNERDLNTDSIARISGSFIVRNNRPATLTIAADILAETDVNYSGSGGLRVIKVETDAGDIDPIITGAAHTLTDSVTLGTLDIDYTLEDGSGEEIEISDDIIELFDADLDADGEEDIRLYSITFEQKGSVSSNDFESIQLLVDRDTYEPTINGDTYTFVFSSRGVLIEENESIDISLEGVLQAGIDRSIEFVIEEPSDVYAIGEDFGYGVRVTQNGKVFDGDVVTNRYDDITGGDVQFSKGSFLSSSDLDLIDGADDQILGGFELDVEGETYAIQGIRGDVELSGIPDGFLLDDEPFEVDSGNTLDINNVVLVVDGRVVGYADNDLEFETDESLPIEFDDTIDFAPGEYEVLIRGDLDDEFPDGASITVILTGVDEIEGYTSGDDISNDKDKNSIYKDPLTLKTATVEGDLIDFSFRSLANASVVADTDDVQFLEFRVDADDTNRDVYLDELEIEAEALTGDLDDIDNCRVYLDDEEVADTRTSLTGSDDTARFEFSGGSRGFTVDAGETETFEILCDIGGAEDDDEFRFSVDDESYLEYELQGLDNQKVFFDDHTGPLVVISGTGTLDADYDPKGTFLVATGENGTDFIKVGEITLEADNEDIEVKEIHFDIVSPSSNADTTVDEIRITGGGEEGTSTVSGDTVIIEDLDAIVEDDESVRFEVWVVFEGIDESEVGASGTRVEIEIDKIVYEGTSSNEEGTLGDLSDLNETIAEVYTYRSLPTIKTTSERNNLLGEDVLYEFAITAGEEGPVSLGRLSFDVNASGVTIGGGTKALELYAFTNSGRSSEVSEAESDGLIGAGAYSSTTSSKISFNATDEDFITIDEGETVYFELVASNLTGAGDDSDQIRTELVSDEDLTSGDSLSAALSSVNALALTIFSPHSDGKTSLDATDNDWFRGFGLFDEEIEAWTLVNR